MTTGIYSLTVVRSSLANSDCTSLFLPTDTFATAFSFAAIVSGFKPHELKYKLPLLSVSPAVVPLASYRSEKLKHKQHTNIKMAQHT